MQLSSLLVCAGATAAGVGFGYFFQPAASKPPPVPMAKTALAEPAVLENPLASKSDPTEQLLTTAGALAYQARLEKLTPAEVCRELRTLNYSDILRKELASARFLRFPAKERLHALLEPPPKEAPSRTGALNHLYLKTAAEMILTEPAAVAQLLNDPAIGQFNGLGPVLEPLFARDGWDAAMDFVGKLPLRAQLEAKPRLASLLAAQDLPRAQAECLKIPAGKDRNALLSAVGAVMADHDPKAALEWARRHFKYVEHEMGHRPTNVVADILRKVMDKDPVAGAALLAENQSAFSRNYGSTEAGELFNGWAAKDFEAAEAWLHANPLGDDLQQSIISSIYKQRLKQMKNAGEAISLYQELPENLKEAAAETLLSKVGIKGLPGGLEGFYETLSHRGRDWLKSQLHFMMPHLNTGEWKQVLALTSKSTDPHAGINYEFENALEQIPEAERAELLAGLGGPMRDHLQVTQARVALQSGDLEKAKSLLLGITGTTNDILPHSEVAVSLARTDPLAGAAWVESLPEEKARSAAAANLAANWAKTDLASAARWASSLPPQSGRDRAIQEIVQIQALTGETGPALELAATIKDESTRLNALASATRSAWFQNQAETRQLLATWNLSPEQTQKVIDRIETGNSR